MEKLQRSKKAAMGFIFITLLIDVTGLGIIIPVLPKLISKLINGNLSEAAQIGGWLTFAYSIMQFICAPLLGNLSDRYGRRPVLLSSLLGFGLDYILLAFAPSIGWLFLGRIIAGVTGASYTVASAYIADVSTDENRAQNFGMIGAAFGLGFIIGPVIGGVLGHYSTQLPFLAAAGLSLLNALYGWLILPESLPAAKRRTSFDWKKANPAGSLMLLKKHPEISGLVTSLVLLYIASHAVQSTWTFINIAKFNWSESIIGISLAIVGVLVAVVQGGLIRFINPKLGNQKSIYTGLALYALGMLLFAFATQTWMMFVFLVPYCLGGIAGPVLQSVISEHVPANQQGELQGALTSLMSVTMIVGPLFMNNLFSWFTNKNAPVYFPGAPFLAGAIFMLISALIAAQSMKRDAFINRSDKAGQA